MEKPSFKVVGHPCGTYGQYTFYKALRCCSVPAVPDRIIALGDFFFVKVWPDSELVSIGELQLLWHDRVSDQTLVSLRLYFMPENTPDGRGAHGEDEVLVISDKVVLKADDLLSWVCEGREWVWGLRAVWRGACAPPQRPQASADLRSSRLDFADIETEKSALGDDDSPGVVVFSYPRYCRYRAIMRRLEGIEAEWLRDSLVSALGGYAAPSPNTRILYCKDTFEYPELEGHQFVCNELAPRLRGRGRGRRRRPRTASPPSSKGSDSDGKPDEIELPPARVTLRNGPKPTIDKDKRIDRDAVRIDKEGVRIDKEGVRIDKEGVRIDKEGVRIDKEEARIDKPEGDVQTRADKAFVRQLKAYYRDSNTPMKSAHNLKDLSLRSLYCGVMQLGGYEAVCRANLWREIARSPALRHAARTNYERLLLPFEKHEKKNGSKWLKVFKSKNKDITKDRRILANATPIDTIDISESPVKEVVETINKSPHRLRTPSPAPSESPKLQIVENVESPKNHFDPSNLLNLNTETGETEPVKDKPAAELNQEFLDSLPKDEKEPKDQNDDKPKISVKPVEKLIDHKVLDQKFDSPIDATETIKKILSTTSNMSEYFKTQDLNDLSAKLLTDFTKTDNNILGEAMKDKLGQIKPSVQDVNGGFATDLSQKYSLAEVNSKLLLEIAKAQDLSKIGLNGLPNGTTITPQPAEQGKGDSSPVSRPPTRSSLRSVRVKPARDNRAASLANTPTHTPSVTPIRTDSNSSSPSQSHQPITNFGINYPPTNLVSVSSSVSVNDQSDDEIIEVPYKPKTPEIIDLDEYESPESPSTVKRKKLEALKERGLEVTTVSVEPPFSLITNPLIGTPVLGLNPVVQHQIMTQAQIFQMYNTIPANYANGIQPPKVIQGTSIFGNAGPEKTVYGNPKDPFMPAPHYMAGMPVKKREVQSVKPSASVPAQDILDLTCKVQKPAVEIVRVPTLAAKPNQPQNLCKNYSLVDGKAVVGSNLEITLVSPKPVTPPKVQKITQKRSSTGRFVKSPTTPVRDVYSKYPIQSNTTSSTSRVDAYKEKPKINIPAYQIPKDTDVSPTSSTSSRDSTQNNLLQNMFKNQNIASLVEMQKNQNPALAQLIDLQKTQNPSLAQIMDLQKCQNPSLAQMMDLQKCQNPSLAQMMEIQKAQNPGFAQFMEKAQNPGLAQLMEIQKSQNPGMAQIIEMQKTQNPSLAQMIELQKTQNPTLAQIMEMQKSQNPTLAQMMDMQKGQNPNLAQIMDMQKNQNPFMDSMYLSALYSSIGSQMASVDPRQLALYRELMTNQLARGYPHLLNMAIPTPTTKS